MHDVKDSWRSYQTIWDDEKAMQETCEEVPEPIEQQEEHQPEPHEQQADQQEEQSEQQPAEDIRAAELTEDPVLDADARWQEMRKEYPKIQPFDYDGGSEVLAIRPDDIGKLPRECWIYGNNSFLLHGYYNYRYLILVRLEQESGPVRYLLGVPGHYYSNEKYMANMFGFPSFVLAKKQPPNDDRFGYWYTEIKID